jgi:hypothetical protein
MMVLRMARCMIKWGNVWKKKCKRGNRKKRKFNLNGF